VAQSIERRAQGKNEIYINQSTGWCSFFLYKKVKGVEEGQEKVEGSLSELKGV
jgi:hypothetical protein